MNDTTAKGPVVDYATRFTPRRRHRPIVVIPPRVARAAAAIGFICAVPAVAMLHSHLIVRSYNPGWYEIVTPAATFVGVCCAVLTMFATSNEGRRAAWLGGVIVMIPLGFCVASMAFGQRAIVCGETSVRVRCASNLRQIGQAIMLYGYENDGRYPQDFSTLLLKTDITSEVFVCPHTNDEPAEGAAREQTAANLRLPQHCSYWYFGGQYASKPAPSDILACERSSNHEGDFINVLFGDFHVEPVMGAAAARIDADLAAGRVPAFAPTPPPTSPATQPVR